MITYPILVIYDVKESGSKNVGWIGITIHIHKVVLNINYYASNCTQYAVNFPIETKTLTSSQIIQLIESLRDRAIEELDGVLITCLTLIYINS